MIEYNGIFEFTPTRTLTDRAYETLEELIVTLRLAPGDVISETALSDRLDIGRTPVREALQRLAREGLVKILPRKGILVTEINPRSQLLLLEVRRELERLHNVSYQEIRLAAECHRQVRKLPTHRVQLIV